MKKIISLLLVATISYSVSATPINNPLNRLNHHRIEDMGNTTASAKGTSIKWRPINTLPFNEELIIDTANGTMINGYRLTIGFTITPTHDCVIGVYEPNIWAFFGVYRDSNLENSVVERNFSIWAPLKADTTYYLTIDDAGVYYFEDLAGDFLTLELRLFEIPDAVSKKSYQDVDYSTPLVLDQTTEWLTLKDTILCKASDAWIMYFSLDSAYHLPVVKDHSYSITIEFNTAGIDYDIGAGVYIWKPILTSSIYNDLYTTSMAGSLYQSEFSTEAMFTATETGNLNITPVIYYGGGVPFRITVKELDVKTVPQALDAALAVSTSDMPYRATGSLSEEVFLTSGDCSLIGDDQLGSFFYHGVTRKVHLLEGDILDIDFALDNTVYGLPYLGYLYIYEKNAGVYSKIGENGYPNEDVPTTIKYIADAEKDLYVIGTVYAYLFYPYDEGDYILNFNYTGSSAIDNLKKVESKVKIYPNPAKDNISISGVNANENISILDVAGRKIKSFSSASVNISDLPDGVYFLRTAQGSTKFIKK